MVANKTLGEKARWELHKIAMCCLERILELTPNKTADVQSLNILSKAIQDEEDMQGTGEQN